MSGIPDQATPNAPTGWPRVTWLDAALCLAPLLLIVISYADIGECDFHHADDPAYILENPHVRDGLTLEGVRWAFTSGHAGNWHPLTWLSHMLDCTLFGLSAPAHHWMNAAWHSLNAATLLLVLIFLTGRRVESLVVACLFAVHPLNVESVAWISERKNLLSTWFWLAAIAGYAWTARQPSVARWLLVVLLCACGLMSKPMVVTLPCTLLLLDAWPLGRWRVFSSISPADLPGVGGERLPSASLGRLLAEKVPLFALVAGVCLITLRVQSAGGMVQSLEEIALGHRLANAPVAYVQYLRQIFWPVGLGFLYPHPLGELPLWKPVGALLLLMVVSGVSWVRRRKAPWLLWGWCWYLGTLVPAIGLVQVGVHAHADRYTYVPALGIFVSVAWMVVAWARRSEAARYWVLLAIVSVLLVLTGLTWFQASRWSDSITLWQHTLQVTGRNPVARLNLARIGIAQAERLQQYGRTPDAAALRREAEQHLQAALQELPRYPLALMEYIKLLRDAGRYEEAWRKSQRLEEMEPAAPAHRFRTAELLILQQRTAEAIDQLSRAQSAAPDGILIYEYLMGMAYYSGGQEEDASLHFRRALDHLRGGDLSETDRSFLKETGLSAEDFAAKLEQISRRFSDRGL